MGGEGEFGSGNDFQLVLMVGVFVFPDVVEDFFLLNFIFL
jgi:hypothetical protein